MIEVDFKSVDFVDWGTVVESKSTSFDMTFQDETGSGIDISSWDIIVDIREEPTDNAATVFSFTVSSHTSPLQGETEYEFSVSDTTDVFGTKYKYITVDRPNNEPTTIAIGPIYFEAGP